MTLRNIVLSIILSLFLLGPLFLLCSQHILKIEIPDWLTAEESQYLEGASSKVDLKKVTSFDGFINGEFQNAIDEKIGNYIPMKADALLTNASIQRFAIDASNKLFGWECYPTFYGNTDTIYSPKDDAIFWYPIIDSERFIEGTQKFAERIAEFSKNNPDKFICIVVPDHPQTSMLNPALNYLNDCFTIKDCVEILNTTAEGIPNLFITSKIYDDTSEYFTDFYRMDHHWNGYGALATYNELPKKFGLKEIQYDGAVPGLSEILENGSSSRSALMLLNQNGNEPNFIFENQHPECPSLLEDENGLEKALEFGKAFEYRFYGGWYGDSKPYVMESSNDVNQDNAVVIANSYGQVFRWLLADSYQNAYIDTKRVPPEGETLSTRMDDTDSDYLYFVLHPIAFTDVYSDNLDYLK